MATIVSNTLRLDWIWRGWGLTESVFVRVGFKMVNGTFDNGNQVSDGSWYRGSQSHSLVSFGNSSWVPEGGYGHEWGLRGAAWVDAKLFSDAIAYVSCHDNIISCHLSCTLPR